jgi:hypothetical protein
MRRKTCLSNTYYTSILKSNSNYLNLPRIIGECFESRKICFIDRYMRLTRGVYNEYSFDIYLLFANNN